MRLVSTCAKAHFALTAAIALAVPTPSLRAQSSQSAQAEITFIPERAPSDLLLHVTSGKLNGPRNVALPQAAPFFAACLDRYSQSLPVDASRSPTLRVRIDGVVVESQLSFIPVGTRLTRPLLDSCELQRVTVAVFNDGSVTVKPADIVQQSATIAHMIEVIRDRLRLLPATPKRELWRFVFTGHSEPLWFYENSLEGRAMAGAAAWRRANFEGCLHHLWYKPVENAVICGIEVALQIPPSEPVSSVHIPRQDQDRP
jgi:hypothetical protein